MSAPVRKRLAEASVALGNVLNDSSGHYDNRYASLARVLDAVRPALAEAGLSLVQDVDSIEHDIGVTTVFVEIETGDSWGTGRVSFPVTDPQRAASAVTYARRFQLLAALGLGSTDDDAQTATSRTQSTATDPRAIERPPVPEERPATRAMIVAIMAAMGEAGIEGREERLAFCANVILHEIESSNDLTIVEAQTILDVLAGRKS